MIRYVRVMGLKEETVKGIGFKRLAIFRPGIISGNAHTRGYVEWVGRWRGHTCRVGFLGRGGVAIRRSDHTWLRIGGERDRS